jgi:DMSO/TMAO reductase YedYZ heme-binding membrane subunit
MAGHFWWYVARSGGLVAWTLIVASCVSGLLLATRTLGGRVTSAWMLALHRYLSALAIVFTAVHVIAIVADDFVHFGIADVLVPLAASWHPLAVAWGVVGMYLLVTIEVTSLLRRHLPMRAWRGIHLLSYALFAVATVHLLTAGTDSADVLPEAIAIGVGVTAVFVGALLLTWRSAPRTRPQRASTDGVEHP